MKDTKWKLNHKVGNYSEGYSANTTTKAVSTVRVKDIILDDSHPDFEKYGEWNGIGTIFFENVKNPILNKNKNKLIAAYPLLPNIKHYPLINELVSIFYLADVDLTTNTTSVAPYYLPPVNVWNSQIHNAVPSSDIIPPEQQKDYQQVEAGSVRRITDQNTEIDLGTTFDEANVLDTYPLLPYEGDIIYEGRFGNSIRFGSTVNGTAYPNPWSNEGDQSEPITIIRNGQSKTQQSVIDTNEPWIPTLENINEDQSSIYLTSTQQIPLELSVSNIDSYNGLSETPVVPELYAGNQILLNSGRLVFNAKNDHIILSADKSVHLVSNNSLNFDTVDKISMTTNVSFGVITLTSPKVYLGSDVGNEGYAGADLQSLVLGENLKQTLTGIVKALNGIARSMKFASNEGGPIASLNTEGNRLGTETENLLSELNNILSKTVKTI
jgi:hypothetical protein